MHWSHDDGLASGVRSGDRIALFMRKQMNYNLKSSGMMFNGLSLHALVICFTLFVHGE